VAETWAQFSHNYPHRWVHNVSLRACVRVLSVVLRCAAGGIVRQCGLFAPFLVWWLVPRVVASCVWEMGRACPQFMLFSASWLRCVWLRLVSRVVRPRVPQFKALSPGDAAPFHKDAAAERGAFEVCMAECDRKAAEALAARREAKAAPVSGTRRRVQLIPTEPKVKKVKKRRILSEAERKRRAAYATRVVVVVVVVLVLLCRGCLVAWLPGIGGTRRRARFRGVRIS